jgi:hypothetical protein
MKVNVRGMIVVLAVSVLSLAFAAGSAARAQDRPGAPPPPTVANKPDPDAYPPLPPGSTNTPAYPVAVYQCAGPGAPTSSEFPPCPPGTASVSKPFHGIHAPQYNTKAGSSRAVVPPTLTPPVKRADPKVEAWMNSPQYRAWQATHDFSTPPMWQCGSGKSVRMSPTPCK